MAFDFLKGILGRDSHRKIVVKDASVPPLRTAPPTPPHPHQGPLVAAEDLTAEQMSAPIDTAAGLLVKALQEEARGIVLDPEEACLICFLLFEDLLTEVITLPRERTVDLSDAVKAYQNRRIIHHGIPHKLLLAITLDDFGERILLQIIPEDQEVNAAEWKKENIRRLNNFKPATSLTRLNVENLISIVKQRRPPSGGEMARLFVEAGILGEIKLKEFIAQAAQTGEPVEYLMLRGAFFPRKQGTALIGRWLERKFVDLEELELKSETARVIPLEMARRLKALPFLVTDDLVRVAMLDPLNEEALAEIGRHVGKKVESFITAEVDLNHVTEKMFKDD